MEIKYQSLEQLQEEGLQVSPFCALDPKTKLARPIIYQIIRPTYNEAIEILKKRAECLMKRAHIEKGLVKCIFGIESKLTEDNQVFVMGQLGGYLPI